MTDDDTALAALRKEVKEALEDWSNDEKTGQALRAVAVYLGVAPVTLDTCLVYIGADNATDIGDDLIDSAVYGDDWGLAWDRVVRNDPDATVRDLRDELESAP